MPRAYHWIAWLAASATVSATAVYVAMTVRHPRPRGAVPGSTRTSTPTWPTARPSSTWNGWQTYCSSPVSWAWVPSSSPSPMSFGRFAVAAFNAGAVVVALAQVAYLAAAERVLAVRAVPGFDPAALATMLDVADRVDDLVECLGLLLIAAGVATVAARAPRRWHRVADGAFLAAIVFIVTATVARSPLTDIGLVVTGGLVVPLWTVRLTSK